MTVLPQATAQPLDIAGWCTVVVPCYNEAERLRTDSFLDFLSHYDCVRLLFVNDGSTDATLAILESMRLKQPGRIHVFDQQPNAGKAEAVRNGMLHAMALDDAAYTGFWDADLATPLAAIPQLLHRLEADPELLMVFGARVRLLGREIHRKSTRHYLGRIFATVVSQFLLHLQIYDTQCGAKLFRVTPELAEMLDAPFSSRWIFDVELLARFIARHREDRALIRRSIYEYPLEKWTDVAGSKIKVADFFNAAFEALYIYRAYKATR